MHKWDFRCSVSIVLSLFASVVFRIFHKFSSSLIYKSFSFFYKFFSSIFSTKDAVGTRKELASVLVVRTGVDRPPKYPPVHLQAAHLQEGMLTKSYNVQNICYKK
jgi:hypothetical protein